MDMGPAFRVEQLLTWDGNMPKMGEAGKSKTQVIDVSTKNLDPVPLVTCNHHRPPEPHTLSL
jgi:hypothetical protein